MTPGLKGFAAELQRRHVYKVGAAYLAVGLAVLGAAELILDPLGLGAVRPIVVVLTLLGFPLALVLAWAYEVRPEELSHSVAESSDKRPSADAERETRESIVVLPFANLSPDPETDYFADGVTEEIINAVANVPGLRVIARTSAFAFKGASRDIREIGKELGVSTVLEGTVRRAGQRVRVTAQLIDVLGGHHLWSERYDRDLEDVFAIQDEIASIIARRLQPGGPTPAVRERPTDNLEAYEAYLRGRFYFAKGTPDSYAKSIQLFERSAMLDPDFAQTHAGIAETGAHWGFWAPDVVPRAKAAAQRALAIDPVGGETHAILGFIRFFHDWDWLGAIEAFGRAIELSPDSPTALILRCGALANLKVPDAVPAGRRSASLDPLSPQVNQTLGWALFQAGDFRESIVYSRRALELAPDHLIAFTVLGFALLETGALIEAEGTYKRMLEVLPGEPLARAGLVHTYTRMKRLDDARALLRELEAQEDTVGQVGVSAAWSNGILGNADAAFECIDRAIEARESLVVSLATFSWWDPLRKDSRFEAVLRRLGFPEWSYRPHSKLIAEGA